MLKLNNNIESEGGNDGRVRSGGDLGHVDTSLQQKNQYKEWKINRKNIERQTYRKTKNITETIDFVLCFMVYYKIVKIRQLEGKSFLFYIEKIIKLFLKVSKGG